MEVIDSAFRKITENQAKELTTHFVCADGIIYDGDIMHEDESELFILQRMKKYKIKKVMVTIIRMERLELITKEEMEKYCRGEYFDRKDSVNDDLESLFEDLRLGKQPDEVVHTYFVPKLMEEEMVLVQRKDTTYFETFWLGDPDVPEAEMLLSESDSKYVQVWGRRRTFTIDYSPEICSDNLSVTSSEESSL